MSGNGRDGRHSGNILTDMLPVAILALLSAAALVWLRTSRHTRGRLWWWAWSAPLLGLAGIALLIGSDVYLQKVVGRLLMPAGLVWLALGAATTMAAVNRHLRTTAALLAITLLYTAAGNIWLGAALMRQLEADMPVVDLASVEPFDAVCVLGGGTELDQFGHPRLAASGERVVYAARCFFAGKTPLLVATGSDVGGGRDLAGETVTIWRELGIPASVIHAVPEPRITRDEIAALHALAQERGWTRVGLVSSAWHLPRALAHAQRLGFAPIPLPCDRLGGSAPAAFLFLIPHHDGFQRIHIALWERLGRLVGR